MSEVTLYLGDCLEYMQTMPGKSVDAVITDPPYEINNGNGGHSKFRGNLRIANRNDLLLNISEGFDIDITFKSINNVCKLFNVFVFCSNKQVSKIMHYGETMGYITTLLVWNKYNSPPFVNFTWTQDAEFIIHMREKNATFQGDTEIKRKVVRIPINASRYGHPTEKPIKLISRYIQISSNEGDTIFDPFMGSGTTGVACIQIGRNFIGCEIDPKYFEIAKKRIEAAQMQIRMEI